MNESDNSILITSVAILLGLALLSGLILALVHEYHLTQREAIKAGLVETPNVGQGGYHWDHPPK